MLLRHSFALLFGCLALAGTARSATYTPLQIIPPPATVPALATFLVVGPSMMAGVVCRFVALSTKADSLLKRSKS
jgi:hypothetical protein